MSEFIANVKAELDPASISKVQQQIKDKLENVKIQLKFDDISVKGASIGKDLANSIAKSIESGGIQKPIDSVVAQYQKLLNSTKMTGNNGLNSQLQMMGSSVTQLRDLFSSLNKAMATGDVGMIASSYTALSSALGAVGNALSSASSEQQIFASNAKVAQSAAKAEETELKETAKAQELLTKSSTLSNKMTSWLQQNTKAAQVYGNAIQELQRQISDSKSLDVTQREGSLRSISLEFARIQSAAKAAGLTTSSFATSLGKTVLQVAGLGSATMALQKALNDIKDGVQTVVDLDAALIDLQKTAQATPQELSDYYYKANDAAKQLGVKTEEIIQASADWSRLGYGLVDSKTMAKVSSIFDSISPDLNMEQSVDGLVASMKAFKIAADDALDDVASKINALGNSQAVSNGDLVDILTRSSAAMAEANNTLDATLALGVAATEVTRDAASVGTALRTISMRIRGYDEETSEFIGGIEELSGDIADLTKTAKTPGGISLFTDATKTEYKSTLELLRDIHDVYSDMTDKQQASLLEKLGGKRGGQVIAAIMGNWEAVESSLATVQNSAGNAMQEMEIIYQSLDYKLNALKETGTGIWQNLFNREDMGMVIDGLTSVLNVIDQLTEQLGLFGTLSVGGGLATGITAFVKNFD